MEKRKTSSKANHGIQDNRPSDVSEERYLKLRRLIRIELAKFGRADETEDALHEFCCRLLEGKSHLQSVRYFVIDYLRAVGGETRSASFGQRQQFEYAVQIETVEFFKELASDSEESLNLRIDLDLMCSMSGSQMDQEIFWLYYVEGFNGDEIAEHYGVCESRIIQILRRIAENVSRNMKGLHEKEEKG